MWERVAWAAVQNPHVVQTGARWAVGNALGIPEPTSPGADFSTPLRYLALGFAAGLAVGYFFSLAPKDGAGR